MNTTTERTNLFQAFVCKELYSTIGYNTQHFCFISLIETNKPIVSVHFTESTPNICEQMVNLYV